MIFATIGWTFLPSKFNWDGIDALGAARQVLDTEIFKTFATRDISVINATKVLQQLPKAAVCTEVQTKALNNRRAQGHQGPECKAQEIPVEKPATRLLHRTKLCLIYRRVKSDRCTTLFISFHIVGTQYATAVKELSGFHIIFQEVHIRATRRL